MRGEVELRSEPLKRDQLGVLTAALIAAGLPADDVGTDAVEAFVFRDAPRRPRTVSAISRCSFFGFHERVRDSDRMVRVLEGHRRISLTLERRIITCSN